MSHRTLWRLHSVQARILREILGMCRDGLGDSSSGVRDVVPGAVTGDVDECSPLDSNWMRFRFIVVVEDAQTVLTSW